MYLLKLFVLFKIFVFNLVLYFVDTRRYHAFLLANQMFGLLLHQCNQILSQNKFKEETSNKE